MPQEIKISFDDFLNYAKKLVLDQFVKNQPKDALPDTFPNAQKAKMDFGLFNKYKGGEYDVKNNSIQLNYLPNEFNPKESYGHELGHAIFNQDINIDNRAGWYDLMQRLSQNIPGPKTKEQDKAYFNSPSALYSYFKDAPHQFAEFYGQYVAQPEKLQREQPEVYNFIRDLARFEYKRTGK